MFLLYVTTLLPLGVIKNNDDDERMNNTNADAILHRFQVIMQYL